MEVLDYISITKDFNHSKQKRLQNEHCKHGLKVHAPDFEQRQEQYTLINYGPSITKKNYL